jgi:carboxypeptidase family protein
MNCPIGKRTTWLAALIMALGFVSTASAQVFTGRVDVTVEDSTGGRLPGVTVDLTGPVNQTQVTDAQGQAHFLNLPVGTYAVKAAISGFNTFTNNTVQVVSGSSTPLTARLGVAGTAETINVTAATPIIDTKRQTTTTNVSLEELQNIPTARDPWVVMQSVPTIYVDRVNVGGSESGQQSNYIGKGSVTTDNTWSIDGVPITDMGATGSTPTYYDFDMFQEMAITTGGADAQNSTPGVQLNMVLKKGQNTPHGNVRYYFENQKLQSTNIPSDLVAALGGTSGQGNRTDFYKDYGFDLGGPILKDKLWAWGSIGRTNVRNLTLTGTPDETILKNYAFKADGQVATSTRANFTFFEGDKNKFGRSAGPTRPPETTWDQAGPTKYYKGEGNFVVGQNLFVAARYAHITGGFGLAPQGGLDSQMYKDDAGTWHNSYYFYKTVRPQTFAGGDASYFAGKHEVKFGFSYRKTPVDSLSGATGNRIVSIATGYPNMVAQASQDFASSTTGKYTSGFVTDTISMDRLTLTAGIRFDRAASSYSATSVPAVTNFPLLPAITAQPVESAYDFTNITPRVGLTYALDDARKTIARVSYAMFASQLPANAAAFVAPIQPYTYVYYNAVDTNGDHVAQLSEIDFASGVQGSNNVDLEHPGVVSTSNKIGDISAPRTQEMMFGVDHEVASNFGLSATFTYRNMNNFLWNPRNGITPASYTQTGTFTGTFENLGSVSIPYYGAADAQPGYTAQNRPDYSRRYLGFELSATKRLSNRWMARVGFGSSSWTEQFGSPAAIMDPTPTSNTSTQFQNLQASGPLIDGGPVVVQTTGSGKSGIYLIAPKYQLSANGMYQGPWGFDFGANFIMRQGYGEPFFRSRVNTFDSVVAIKNLLLVAPDANRLDTVSTLDGRVSKVFKFNRTSFALDFDVFNMFNRATVLGKQYDARLTTYNSTLEIMNPRIARLGVRFFF